MNILIPMAGLGDRFRKAGYTTSKPMILVDGKPMIQLAIESLGLFGRYIFVINRENEMVEELKSLLRAITSDPIIIEIDYLTEGPTSTCLLAKHYIDTDEPLVIANCDQIMKWNSHEFFNHINNTSNDGVVVTYNVITEKNSYVKLDEFGFAIEFAEKKIISDESLNGIHFWKKGSDFIKSAETMINKNIRVNNEFYIAPTYNELIVEGKKITTYPVKNNEHWAVGTPEDLEKYLSNENV